MVAQPAIWNRQGRFAILSGTVSSRTKRGCTWRILLAHDPAARVAENRIGLASRGRTRGLAPTPVRVLRLKHMNKRPRSPLVTARDLQLLRGLFEMRVLTLAHITQLYFAGAAEAAKKRVQILKAARLIAQRPRPRPYDRSILFLAKQGFELLSDGGHVSDYPRLAWHAMAKRVRVSPRTLEHELSVNQIRVVFSVAVSRSSGCELPQFLTWPKLFAFQVQTAGWNDSTMVRPDGYLELIDHGGGVERLHFAYLEVDRSTETLGRLTDKAAHYLQHYRGGGFARSHGRSASDYKSMPFRVLFVLANEERRNNLAAALLAANPPILSLAWLTTLERILADPLGAIWMRPCDYRDAVQRAGLEDRPKRPYRRRPHREQSVARQVQLHPLHSERP